MGALTRRGAAIAGKALSLNNWADFTGNINNGQHQ
jgi:hypothetical protein